MIKLIAGLGNPGEKYRGTRHNIGFDVIDELAHRLQSPLTTAKHKGIYTIVRSGGHQVLLLKPLTYMNLSGESIAEVMRYYKIDIENLLVVYDDLDLPPGKIRLRQKGSAGGHNGIKSVIQHTGTEQFKRIRIGIGRPDGNNTVIDYVLGKFDKEQRLIMNEAVKKSADACLEWLEKPFPEVMNQFNS